MCDRCRRFGLHSRYVWKLAPAQSLNSWLYAIPHLGMQERERAVGMLAAGQTRYSDLSSAHLHYSDIQTVHQPLFSPDLNRMDQVWTFLKQ